MPPARPNLLSLGCPRAQGLPLGFQPPLAKSLEAHVASKFQRPVDLSCLVRQLERAAPADSRPQPAARLIDVLSSLAQHSGQGSLPAGLQLEALRSALSAGRISLEAVLEACAAEAAAEHAAAAGGQQLSDEEEEGRTTRSGKKRGAAGSRAGPNAKKTRGIRVDGWKLEVRR